jgi:hypothetical protein
MITANLTIMLDNMSVLVYGAGSIIYIVYAARWCYRKTTPGRKRFLIGTSLSALQVLPALSLHSGSISLPIIVLLATLYETAGFRRIAREDAIPPMEPEPGEETR